MNYHTVPSKQSEEGFPIEKGKEMSLNKKCKNLEHHFIYYKIIVIMVHISSVLVTRNKSKSSIDYL